MANLMPAPEVEKVAQSIIGIHHPHLHGTRIEYHFREKGKVTNDVRTWGTASLVTGANALMATPGAHSSVGLEFFRIEMAEDVWNELSPAQKVALTDHELSHCGVTTDKKGNVKLYMVHHDLEEFSGVLRRHGMWKAGIANFLSNVGTNQLEFFTDTLDNMPDLSVYDPAIHGGTPPPPNQPRP